MTMSSPTIATLEPKASMWETEIIASGPHQTSPNLGPEATALRPETTSLWRQTAVA